MEDSSAGQCDSDVSDSWSVVDYKSEEIGVLLSSVSDNLTGSQTSDNQADIDECFELTEMLIADLSAAVAPLGADGQLSKQRHESEGDTDGISVISDDEEYVNWKQEAHDNYRNTMKLLENSSDSPFLRRLPETSGAVAAHSDDIEAELGNSASTISPPEAETQGLSSHEAVATDSSPVTDVVLVADADDSWQENCTHFLNKYFFTSAVIAAITCIALAHFLKSFGTKDKVVEMLEVLERLRTENELLKVQYDHLITAYAALEAKVADETPIFVKATAANNAGSLKDEASHSNIISQLSDLISSDPLVKELQTKLQRIPASRAAEFRPIEWKIVSNIARLLKTDEDHEKVRKTLRELNERLQRRFSVKNKSAADSGMKIVQWFSDDDKHEEGIVQDKVRNAPVTDSAILNENDQNSLQQESKVSQKNNEDIVDKKTTPAVNSYNSESDSNNNMPLNLENTDGDELESPYDNFKVNKNFNNLINNKKPVINNNVPSKIDGKICENRVDSTSKYLRTENIGRWVNAEKNINKLAEEDINQFAAKHSSSFYLDDAAEILFPESSSENKIKKRKAKSDSSLDVKTQKGKYDEVRKIKSSKKEKYVLEPKMKVVDNKIQEGGSRFEKGPKDKTYKARMGKLKSVSSEWNEKGAWYLSRMKARENIRTENWEKSKVKSGKCSVIANKTTDWYLQRAKAREMKRDAEDPALWYFRKMTTRGSF